MSTYSSPIFETLTYGELQCSTCIASVFVGPPSLHSQSLLQRFICMVSHILQRHLLLPIWLEPLKHMCSHIRPLLWQRKLLLRIRMASKVLI